MPVRPPDEASIERLLCVVDIEVAAMVRLSRRPATEPWWSRAATGRFDDPQRRFGVCYAADSLETAFCESTLHDSGFHVDGRYVIASADLLGRFRIGFDASHAHAPGATLRLADLTGKTLKRLGLNNDVSATDDYSMTQQWARAIHEHRSDCMGIRYVSRQQNLGFCYALFERSGIVRASVRPLSAEEIERMCQDFRIAVAPR